MEQKTEYTNDQIAKALGCKRVSQCGFLRSCGWELPDSSYHIGNEPPDFLNDLNACEYILDWTHKHDYVFHVYGRSVIFWPNDGKCPEAMVKTPSGYQLHPKWTNDSKLSKAICQAFVKLRKGGDGYLFQNMTEFQSKAERLQAENKYLKTQI